MKRGAARQCRIAGALACIFVGLSPWIGLWSLMLKSSLSSITGQSPPLRCAVLNPVDWHADVAAGFIWAFQEAGCNLSSYINNGYGIKDVITDWYTGDFRNSAALEDDIAEFHLIVIVTFTDFAHMRRLVNLSSRSQRIIVLAHNPKRDFRSKEFAALAVREAMVPPGVPRLPQVQLMSIAPHVSAYTTSLLNTWTAGVGVAKLAKLPWIVPLFPLASTTGQHSSNTTFKNLCIQGLIDLKRRSYDTAFNALKSSNVLPHLKDTNESLVLLGVGLDVKKLNPPNELAEHVRIISHGMPYKEFYAMLASTRAILTAFATDDYLIHKASSSIAAALNAGAPLLGDSRFLEAYTFLDEKATFTFNPSPNTTWPDAAAEGVKEALLMLVEQKIEHNISLPALDHQHVHMSGGHNTYDDALLQTFDKQQIRASHGKARQLKLQVMQRNAQTAKQILDDTLSFMRNGCNSH